MTDPIREALERLVTAYDTNEGLPIEEWLQVARAALAGEPPAPDPHEALAARPLLEAVVALEVYNGPLPALQQRISAWLAENPPGQPVAIEPRGCPIPGACSCVEPAAPEAGAALSLAAIIRSVDGSHSMGAAALADAILSHPDAASVFQPPAPAPVADHIPDATEMAPATYGARLRQCPTHGQQPANTWGCPACLRELREELARVKAPAADGEREELAEWLYRLADERTCNRRRGIRPHPSALTRAAVLLQRSAPAPLPVAERPWEREGWCDAEGQCWWFAPAEAIPHCLPHWAILQSPQGEEVAE